MGIRIERSVRFYKNSTNHNVLSSFFFLMIYKHRKSDSAKDVNIHY